jgi:hypothetical protein
MESTMKNDLLTHEVPIPHPHGWRKLALPGFGLLCWFLAIRHLSSDWTLNEQYHDGWTVPLSALHQIWMRLENPPAPSLV